ncbi:MAG TPA: di-heme oxidoredictase family protein, partial [Polyangiaceae bacterium]|nr:di-heme oxidoredictase family protein [Polyangiaceae bacterium]
MGGPPESTNALVASTSEAVTAQTSTPTNGALAILVSGTITGNNGNPLPGVTVMLGGQVGPQGEPTSLPTTTTTNTLGYYSFAVNAPGNGAGGGTVTVSIQPTQQGTIFSLAEAVDGNNVGATNANLANISTNTTVNFNANVPGTAVTVAVDPGVRTGAPGAGAFPALTTTNPTCVPGQSGNDCPLPNASACISGLSAANLAFCLNALVRFQEVDSVSGTDTDGPNGGAGLGPTFNGNSCAQCHAQPSVLGSSPGLASPQRPVGNPQVALASLDGATNSLSTIPFITLAGPTREVRFASDSGVHNIFSIAGRNDAPGCTAAIEPQPAAAAGATPTNLTAGGTISFRIPTPTFGLGLVENVTDNALRANLDATPTLGGTTGPTAASLGITGSLQTSGNDGTVTRFGWKAQNKSLLIFSGEAYNVEMGVSNENFQNERTV